LFGLLYTARRRTDRRFFRIANQDDYLRSRHLIICLIGLNFSGIGGAYGESTELSTLGQALFFDTNLSLTRHQACSSCHEPGRAFSDGRVNDVGGAASTGDNGVSLGDRNAPSIAYAHLVPDFHRNDAGEYVGGFFLDGRSATMKEQAAEPFFNPVEMAMPNRSSVLDRVRENPSYVETLQSIYGADLFRDEGKVFDAVVESIVAFENAEPFSPFDSKYDRFLRGEYEMTSEEELGRLLFFSQLIGCHGCHLLDPREAVANELFTNHTYHNIGIPVNAALREKNGVSQADLGLLANPDIDDPALAGKFRVPSLRNVAVTAPYMHNGVFKKLETAILFYDKYLVSNRQSESNPETGEPWGDPEVAGTIDLELLQQGQPITEDRARALAAFLRTLTDQRYEALLDQ